MAHTNQYANVPEPWATHRVLFWSPRSHGLVGFGKTLEGTAVAQPLACLQKEQ